jgi:Lanthionine-containing peptide SapB precursor RamS
MALLDLQGMETTGGGGHGGGGKDHSGLSALICGGDDSSLSVVLC